MPNVTFNSIKISLNKEELVSWLFHNLPPELRKSAKILPSKENEGLEFEFQIQSDLELQKLKERMERFRRANVMPKKLADVDLSQRGLGFARYHKLETVGDLLTFFLAGNKSTFTKTNEKKALCELEQLLESMELWNVRVD